MSAERLFTEVLRDPAAQWTSQERRDADRERERRRLAAKAGRRDRKRGRR